MIKSDIIKILKTFSKKEFKQFGAYIRQPYVNNRSAVVRLYDVLFPKYPDFGEDLDSKIVFEKLFPGKKFNGSSFRVITHCLSELAVEFITINRFKSKKLQFEAQKVTELTDRNLLSIADKSISEMENKLNPVNLDSTDYFYNKYVLSRLKTQFEFVKKSGVFEKFLAKAGYDKTFSSLREFFHLETLKTFIVMVNINNIFGERFDKGPIEKFINEMDDNDIKAGIGIEIYYNIAKMIADSDSTGYYLNARQLAFRHVKALNHEDLHEIFINLENYCNRKIYGGELDYYREKFLIYKKEIENKIYMLNGRMSHIFYKNAVFLGIRLKEYDWVKEFMEKYRQELEEKFEESVYNHCMAIFEFEMKNYEKSLRHLSMIGFEEVYLRLDSRVLQIQNYFELGDTEPMFHALESLRQYLSNEKLIPENRKPNYRKFCTYLTKIVRCKEKNKKLELEMIKQNVTKEKTLVSKDWVIRVIERVLSS